MPFLDQAADHHAGLPSGRLHARLPAHPRPDGRRARHLDRLRYVAERLWRRRRHRQADGGVDRRRRAHLGCVCLPRHSLWQLLRQPVLRRRAHARVRQVLLSPEVPQRRERVGAPAPHQPGALPPAGIWAPSLARSSAGSASTTSSPASPGAWLAPTSANGAGTSRPSSSAWARSTRPPASAWRCST